MGAAAVRGLQGQTMTDATSVLACAKHYVGDGGTKGGIDQGNTECDLATLEKSTCRATSPPSRRASARSWLPTAVGTARRCTATKSCSPACSRGSLASRASSSPTGRPSTSSRATTSRPSRQSINAGIDMVMIPNGPGQKNNYVDFISMLKELVNGRQGARNRGSTTRSGVFCFVKSKMRLFGASVLRPGADRRSRLCRAPAGRARVRAEVARAAEE